MPFNAVAIKVMIASPGDVEAERNAIRDIIHVWNVVHAEDDGVVLLPVGWDTHATPELGDRPQAIINKQVLKSCDLLVAVFWTRLGSPTGKAASGTVEEINEHVAAGKPAMLYFSDAPKPLSTVDPAQHKALLDFRSEYKDRGLIETYSSHEEFKLKFSRQLAQTIIRYVETMSAAPKNSPLTSIAVSGPTLSDHAKQLLLDASRDKTGIVMRIDTWNGLSVTTNDKEFVKLKDPRNNAIWNSAIGELVDFDFLEARTEDGTIYGMTNKGYQFADQLSSGTA